ncbi:MAG TPA: SDR family NAD(P)-dependent oxidoreductase [Solirubrobacterales bacterium]|jgi:NAD(P)-dependent dehydrogenase (short-subunit alcohol dehydrogenase family)|nr:SDR family NAD(P)-dependent oxidoreductase [Solirubrobacterales bacterium]
MSRAAQDTVALVTGATDGLGLGVAERLAGMGMTVHLHGRSAEKLAAAAGEIVAATGNDKIHTHRADFASLAEVHALAEEIGALPALHLLVNNAGIGSGLPDSPDREESSDGLELRFAVNYLASFVLTTSLLPLLERSAPARVVMVASLGQASLDFDDPQLERSLYEGRRAYAQSKLAQISFANELAYRLSPDAEVTVNSLHPATFMPTKIVLDERGTSVDALDRGVDSTVHLATDPALDGVTGRFFDREAEARAEDQAYDPEARRRLWELSEALADGRG